MNKKTRASMAKSLADLLMVSPETGGELGIWNVGNDASGKLCIGLGDEQGEEFWILKTQMVEASEFEVKALKRMDAEKPSPPHDEAKGRGNKPIDLKYLGEHDHISITDAQALHSIFMRQHGIVDPDEVIADWNRRDPEAPWGSGIVGKYVHELTAMVCEFMNDKITEAKAELNKSDSTEH